MAEQYSKRLIGVHGLTLPPMRTGRTNVHWMYAVVVENGFGKTRNGLMAHLLEQGIDTRTFFAPLHRQPVLRRLGLHGKTPLPVSEDLSRRGLYLPSGLAITEHEIDRVCEVVRRAARSAR